LFLGFLALGDTLGDKNAEPLLFSKLLKTTLARPERVQIGRLTT
jgi:hypothetical protein